MTYIPYLLAYLVCRCMAVDAFLEVGNHEEMMSHSPVNICVSFPWYRPAMGRPHWYLSYKTFQTSTWIKCVLGVIIKFGRKRRYRSVYVVA